MTSFVVPEGVTRFVIPEGVGCPESVSASLWSRLETEARLHARSNEPAHDFFHVERVVTNARAIARGEKLSATSEGVVVVHSRLRCWLRCGRE